MIHPASQYQQALPAGTIQGRGGGAQGGGGSSNAVAAGGGVAPAVVAVQPAAIPPTAVVNPSLSNLPPVRPASTVISPSQMEGIKRYKHVVATASKLLLEGTEVLMCVDYLYGLLGACMCLRVWLWSVSNVSSELSGLTHRLIDTFGCHRIGRWSVTCEHLHFKRQSAATGTAAVSTAPLLPPKEVYRLHLSSHPNDSFLVTMTSVQQLGLQSDDYLTSTGKWGSKGLTRIEGEVFSCGDMTIRLGTVKQTTRGGGSTKADASVCLEIECKPCILITPSTFTLLASFCATLCTGLPNSTHIQESFRPKTGSTAGWPNFHEFQLGSVFTARHRCILWLFAMQSMFAREKVPEPAGGI